MKHYFTTKQVLLTALLGGPLGGLWAIAENVKVHTGHTPYRYFLNGSIIATAIILATLFIFSNGQPAAYWPLVFAFIIAVVGELLYGEHIDKAIETSEATQQDAKCVVWVITVSLLIQFLMLLLIIILLK